MRTLPLSSSVFQMPTGVLAATAGAATGAVLAALFNAGTGGGAGGGLAGTTSCTTGGADGVEASVCGTGAVGAGAGAVAAICGAAVGAGACGAAMGAGTVFAGGVESAISSSDLPKLRPFRLKPDLDRPGAEIWMQSSRSQCFGTSIWTFCPWISKETEFPVLPA